MANLEGMQEKFTVLNNQDLDVVFYNNPYLKDEFLVLIKEIKRLRDYMEKKDNKYLVINTDEPYADEIIEIMKRHGHWG